MIRPGSRATAASAPSAPTTRPAPHIVTLQASDFVETWPRIPDEHGALIGIRLVGEQTIVDAEKRALEKVAKAYLSIDMPPDLFEVRRDIMLEQYNKEQVVLILAHALCKHDDVKTHYFTKAPEVVIPFAFHPGTIEMLWSEYLTLRTLLSPTVRLATDAELSAIMPDPSRASNRLRRLVALTHDELALTDALDAAAE